APHNFENGFVGLVVYVALNKLKHVLAIAGILEKSGEVNVQFVIQSNELVPVFQSATNRAFEFIEAGAPEIARLRSGKDSLAREPRGIQSHAHATGKNWVHKPRRIPNHQEPVPADLLHAIAVVALHGPRSDSLRLPQVLGKLWICAGEFPKECFPLILPASEVRSRRHHADACNVLTDRNLPDPAMADRQKVDEDVVVEHGIIGEGRPLIT